MEKLLEKSDFGSKDGQDGLVAQIPVLESVKIVLDYLSYVSGDSEFVDVPTMVMSLPEELANEYDEDDSDGLLDMSDDDAQAMENYGIDAEKAQLLAEINAATTKANETIEPKPPSTNRENQENQENHGVEECKSISLENLYSSHILQKEGKTPFLVFLERFKEQSAEVLPVVRSLQSFVAKIQQESINANLKFDSERTQEDRHRGWAKAIKDFLLKTQEEMRALSYWADEPVNVWEQTTQHLEKFLFIKLYPIIFGRDANVVAQDEVFFKRLQSLAFLAPEHLDIKSLLLTRKGFEESNLLVGKTDDDKCKDEDVNKNEAKESNGSHDKIESNTAQPWEAIFHEPVKHFSAARSPSHTI